MSHGKMFLVGLSALLASSCGESGSSSSTDVVISAPSPSPPPLPLPSPTPPSPADSYVNFVTPSVATLLATDGGAQVASAIDDGSTVSASDHDAPAAKAFEDLILNGNEEFNVKRQLTGSEFTASVSTTDRMGCFPTRFYSLKTSDTPRNLTECIWKRGESRIVLLQTQDIPVPSPEPTTPDFPGHARIIETVLPDRQGLQIFGSTTSTSNWPTVDGSVFEGEACGTVFTPDKQRLSFVGDANINVDPASKDSQIHGIVEVSQYDRQNNRGLPITIEIVADIVANRIITRSLRVDGAGGMVAYGSVSGSFYGPSANELGLVFSASGEPGSMMGAMIVKLHR